MNQMFSTSIFYKDVNKKFELIKFLKHLILFLIINKFSKVKIKVLFETRLFSGLKSNAKSGKWTPTGGPTIYKIIERIANSQI